MRFQVPQNLDVADTIILGLSFKQMLYLGGALGLFIFLFFFAGGILPAAVIGGPVGILAALLSFFNFNGQPFSVLLQAIIRFFMRKKMFVWRKGENEKFTKRKIQRDVSEQPLQNKGDGERVKDLNANLIFDDEVYSSDTDIEPNI